MPSGVGTQITIASHWARASGVRRRAVPSLPDELLEPRSVYILDIRTPDCQCTDLVEVVFEANNGEAHGGELDGQWQSDVTLTDDADLRTPVHDQIDKSFPSHGCVFHLAPYLSV